MNEDKNVFDQPINNNFETYENIRKVATGQEDEYATDCLLDYMFFLISNSIFGFNIWNSANNFFCSSVFNVGGCLASCLIFRLFLMLHR